MLSTFQYTKAIAVGSVPLLGASLLSLLMSLNDGVFLLMFDVQAFSALVLIIPILTFVASLAAGLGIAFINQYQLANTPIARHRVMTVSACISTIALTLATVFFILGFEDYLQWQGVSSGDNIQSTVPVETQSSLWRYANQYGYIILVSFWFSLPVSMYLQYLSAIKCYKQAFHLACLISTMNIALTPIAIFSLHLGIIGAAGSTLISFLLGIIIIIKRHIGTGLNQPIRLSRHRQFSPIQLAVVIVFTGKRRSFIRCLKKQLVDAMAIFTSMGILSIGQLFLNRLALSHSATAFLVFGVLEQLKLIVTLPTRAVLTAYMAMFAHSLRYRKIQTYYSLYWSATACCGIIYLLFAILFYFTRNQLVTLLNIKAYLTEQQIDHLFLWLTALFILCILPRASQIGFVNLHKPLYMVWQSVALIVLSYLFIDYQLTNNGLIGIISGQVIAMFFCNVIFLPLFFKRLNRRIQCD